MHCQNNNNNKKNSLDNVLAWNYVFRLWTFSSTLKHNTVQCIIQTTVKTLPHINVVH